MKISKYEWTTANGNLSKVGYIRFHDLVTALEACLDSSDVLQNQNGVNYLWNSSSVRENF